MRALPFVQVPLTPQAQKYFQCTGYSAAVRRANIARGVDWTGRREPSLRRSINVHMFCSSHELHACTALISPYDPYRACMWCRFGVRALFGPPNHFPWRKVQGVSHRMKCSVLSRLSHTGLFSRMVTGARTTAVEDVSWEDRRCGATRLVSVRSRPRRRPRVKRTSRSDLAGCRSVGNVHRMR
jgi:hypothetical protein